MTDPDDTDVDRDDGASNGDFRSDGGEPLVVFEFTIPADELALADALREFPGVTVETERLVPTNGRPIPYLWVTGGESPGFEELVAADPKVERVERAATFDDGALYRVEWRSDDGGLLHRVANTHEEISLLQATGRAGRWTLKLRFPSRSLLADFRAFYEEQGIDLRVRRLYHVDDPKAGQYDVSRKQREALVRALEMGYFEIPREATLGEVADSLGITSKSTSERLRRGQTNLVGNSLATGRPTGVGIGGG